MKIIDANGIEREAKAVAPDPGYPGFVKIQFKRHHEWLSFDEFVKKNPNLAHLIKDSPPPPQDVVGTVTSAGKDFLRDTTQHWDDNAYLGMFVWISRGKGEGQKRTVVKNTKNQVKIDQPWDQKPDQSSQYVISYNIQEVKAMGNVLPAENMKQYEKEAIRIDRRRGRLNKQYKYLKPEELD